MIVKREGGGKTAAVWTKGKEQKYKRRKREETKTELNTFIPDRKKKNNKLETQIDLET